MRQRLAVKIHRDDFELLFFNLDKDKDGLLNFIEFCKVAQPAKGQSQSNLPKRPTVSTEDAELFAKILIEEMDCWLAFEDMKYRLI